MTGRLVHHMEVPFNEETACGSHDGGWATIGEDGVTCRTASHGHDISSLP